MKQTKLLISLSLLALQISTTNAANIQTVWEPFHNQLSTYQLQNTPMTLLQSHPFAAHSNYHLQFVYQNKTDNIEHQRFQMQYQGLDIFGYHMMLHHYPNKKSMITGHIIKHIENDVPSLVPNLSTDNALAKALQLENLNAQQIKHQNVQKIIYIDPETSKAHLAYLVSFYGSHLSQPMTIVDAHNSEILRQWNNLKSDKLGEGTGGNSISPQGAFDYVLATSRATEELPPFDVTIDGSNYNMSTPELQLRDFNNVDSDPSVFPVSIAGESSYAVYSFARPTNADGGQLVSTDTAFGTNHAYPTNDAMFHAGSTIDMLKNVYGVSAPLGTDLPLQIYARVQSLDNAYSMDTIETGGAVTTHQQLVIGNGNTTFLPLALGTMAHELCHNVTNQFSQMIYAAQSGGMNEAFSDMCEMALNNYIRTNLEANWYWDGETYNIGENETQSKLPLRYMANPSADGNSINNANDYSSGLDVHYSSGVFNRAYYLIAMTYGFGPELAFRYMMNANMNYWVPNNTFVYGACGTIQAAYDRGENYKNVIEAFKGVGLTCKLFSPLKQVQNNSYN